MENVKVYVLDTNVLVHDPDAILKFENNRVVIPICVVEELDGLKKDQRETGRQARHTLRKIDKLVEEGKLDGKASVNDSGGTLEFAVDMEQYRLAFPSDLDWKVVDNKILAVAAAFDAILVTKDTNLRIKAHAVGIAAQNYENDKVDVGGLYTGHREGYLSEDDLNLLYSQGYLAKECEHFESEQLEYYPNMCLTLFSLSNPKHSAIVRYDSKMDIFVLISGSTMKPAGLAPKNSEQLMALDLLLNPDIKLVSIVGKAGCGKTLCALAAALHGVLDSQEYNKVLVARPIVPMGNDVGYLPGELSEKLAPYMAPIKDNIDFLMNISMRDQRKAEKAPAKSGKTPKVSKVRKELEASQYEKDVAKLPGMEELIAHDLLEVGALTYIRGRSLPNLFIMIDEAQQLTPHEIKTIVTRAGEGTKVVFTGDIEQIDAPYLDASSNGLSYIVDRFKGEAISAHITLTKSERSELADIASRIL